MKKSRLRSGGKIPYNGVYPFSTKFIIFAPKFSLLPISNDWNKTPIRISESLSESQSKSATEDMTSGTDSEVLQPIPEIRPPKYPTIRKTVYYIR